jgi:hypothetical protein
MKLLYSNLKKLYKKLSFNLTTGSHCNLGLIVFEKDL